MSISIEEQLVSLSTVGLLLPTKPHRSTVIRWWKRGVRGIRLETLLIGGVRYTSHEALDRFFNASTVAAEKPPPGDEHSRSSPNHSPTPSASTPRGRKAKQVLDDAGIFANNKKEEMR